MANLSTKFASNSQEWTTPPEVIEPLRAEFSFSLDVCATQENRQAPNYFDQQKDGLRQAWTGTCWMNPPFNKVGVWVKKAYESSLAGATVVCLVPSRTNTNWWHDYCLKGEVRFIRGRPAFNGVKHGLPQPLAIVVFRPARS